MTEAIRKSVLRVAQTHSPLFTGGHAAITADESFLVATAGNDVNVVDLTTGARRVLVGNSDDATCFAVKPDGRHAVVAYRSLLLSYFDFVTGQHLRSWKAHQAPVLVMAFDATSTLVATGSADSTIRVWDVDRGFATHWFKGHSGVVSAVTFFNSVSSTKKPVVRLASASDDCKIRIWDLESKSCTAVLDGHVSVVRGLSFSPDGLYLISGGRDSVINLWDLKSGEALRTVPVNESVETTGCIPLAASRKIWPKAKGPIVFAGGERGVIRIWDMATGACLQTQPSSGSSPHQIALSYFLPTANELVIVTTDQNILFVSLSEGLSTDRQIIGYNDEIVDLQYVTPDESKVALATNSEQIRLFDLTTPYSDILYGHTDAVICLSVSSDGLLLASGSKDRSGRIWRYKEETKKFFCAGLCLGHTEAIGAISISRKSNSFVITGGQDRTVKLWDTSSLKDATDKESHLKATYTVLAHDKDINSVAVAPNDKVFATGSQDRTAKIWSVKDGALLGVCKGHTRGVWSVQFSPVDQVLATSSGDKTIKFWSAADFSCLRTFHGHLNSVLRIHFVSLGMQLLSVGSDGLLKLWNIKDSDCAGTFDNHSDKVWALTVHKSEKLFLTGSADSTLTVWEDWTKESKELESQEMDLRTQKEQDLSNAVHRKDFLHAFALCMELDKPMRLLTLLEELGRLNPDPHSKSGMASVDEFIAKMDTTKLEQLLKYVRDWNTRNKHTHIAQLVLNIVLTAFTYEELFKVPSIKELMEALIPYTERRYAHTDELLKRSYVVSFTLSKMDDLLG
ncbi:quinon protein alcohol dehydrogenase-like superfamily, partial [Zopfochytrium polystomum]